MKRTKKPFFEISIRVEVFKFVKVSAYKRIRNGKVERVKSHSRKY